MERDDIIRMAREAGLGRYLWLDNEFVNGIGAMYQVTDETVVEMMERFAALVAAREREACARVCDAKVKDEYATGLIDHHEIGWTESCAFAIRARGKA